MKFPGLYSLPTDSNPIRAPCGISFCSFNGESIRNQYFDGESVLLKDADEDLEHQTKAVRLLIDRHDCLVIEAGEPERAIDSSKFQKDIREQASYRAGLVVALAKSKMLEDFGEHEAADEEIRPYVLEKNG